jgi:hypothetical protein
MGFIFINQFPVYDKIVFNQILRDQFVQKWLNDIYSSSRGQLYSCFQKGIENYLLRLSEHSRIWITKFRTSNLHLPIETGRWYIIRIFFYDTIFGHFYLRFQDLFENTQTHIQV